jgi:hypothetical protein
MKNLFKLNSVWVIGLGSLGMWYLMFKAGQAVFQAIHGG